MKTTPTSPLASYEGEITRHRSWLRLFSNKEAQSWENLLKSDWEAAVVEACTRYFLSGHVESIEPTGPPGPDFCCIQGKDHFYVEATCLQIDRVTRATALPPKPGGSAHHYKPLTGVIMNECVNKAPQCSGLDGPCLLAIGTLHYQGGCSCFDKPKVEDLLTGTTSIRGVVSRETGNMVSGAYLGTDLRDSAFVRFNKAGGSQDEIESARRSISGLLLFGFGSKTPIVQGVLHPDSVRPFNRALLPRIHFCALRVSRDKKNLIPTWV